MLDFNRALTSPIKGLLKVKNLPCSLIGDLKLLWQERS